MEKRMIKVRVETIDKDDTDEVVIKCHEITDEVLELMKKLQASEAKPTSLVGTKDEQIYTIKLKDILYIEATENKTFIYCADDFFESKLKLYEIEEILAGTSFFRCSKSMILHASKINYVSPAFNGRFEARLVNDERIIISRQYVPNLKKILGI